MNSVFAELKFGRRAYQASAIFSSAEFARGFEDEDASCRRNQPYGRRASIIEPVIEITRAAEEFCLLAV